MDQTKSYLTDYDDLPLDIKDNLVSASFDFMRALADCASPEAAEAAWHQIADVVHPSLKHDLLMRMLSGGAQQSVILTDCGANFINCIKTIREYTSMGLKEAKDMCDAVRAGIPQRIRLANWRQRRECLDKFNTIGATAH